MSCNLTGSDAQANAVSQWTSLPISIPLSSEPRQSDAYPYNDQPKPATITLAVLFGSYGKVFEVWHVTKNVNVLGGAWTSHAKTSAATNLWYFEVTWTCHSARAGFCRFGWSLSSNPRPTSLINCPFPLSRCRKVVDSIGSEESSEEGRRDTRRPTGLPAAAAVK